MSYAGQARACYFPGIRSFGGKKELKQGGKGTAGMAEPRILLIEDDDGTAADLVRLLGAEGWTADRADTLEGGMVAALAGGFDVIVLDRMLPGGDGIDAIARLRAGGSGAMILVLSALGLAGNRAEGLERGADDYLAKPFEPVELTARVRALMRRRRGQVADNDLIVFGPIEIRLKARTVHVGAENVALSPREFDLLVVFARNHGNVLTRMQLLEQVWNLHFDPGSNVVDVHVSRLRRKLEAATTGPVLHTERGAGYVFDPSRDSSRDSGQGAG